MLIKKKVIYIFLIPILLILLSNSIVNIKFHQKNELENSERLSTSSNGETVYYNWLQTWNENYYSNCYAMALDTCDNTYLGGFTHVRNGNRESCFVKYNSDGIQQFNVTWSGSGGNDECRAIAVDSSFNIYIAGNMYEHIVTEGSSHFIVDQMYLAKFNSSGSYQWHTTWNGVSKWSDRAFAIAIDSLNNIYIVGDSSTSQWESKITLIKFNSTGGEEWYRIWGGRSGRGITIDSSNNIYIVGSAGGDICLVKYDYNGQQLWNRTWGGSDEEFGSAITLDSLYNIYIAGSTKSYGNGDYDMALVKFDSSGTFQWNHTFGYGGKDLARTVSCDSLDNIYIGGAVGCNIGIARYNKSGEMDRNVTWGSEKIGQEGCTYKDKCYGIKTDSSDNIYIGGFVDYSHFFLMKCDSEFGISKFKDVVFTVDQKFSKWFHTDMELDPIARIYRDRSREAHVLFKILGYEHYFIISLIDKSFADSIKIITMDKKSKNETEMILKMYEEKNITYNKNLLYRFYFSYYHSYESCIRSDDGIYCDESITKIAQGEYNSTDFYSISKNGVKVYIEENKNILGFNFYIISSLIGFVSLLIYCKIKKRI